jgi:hypothetical protein
MRKMFRIRKKWENLPVWIAEFYNGQGCATAGVVDDVLDDSLDVTVTFGIITGAKPGCPFAVFVVRGKDGTRPLTLRSDNSTHCSKVTKFFKSKGKFGLKKC